MAGSCRLGLVTTPEVGARDPGLAATKARCNEIAALLLELVTPELIEEHRRASDGMHSPALALLLAHLRQSPVAGKLVVHASSPGREWRILRLSGEQAVPHDTSDPRVFRSEAEAVHAVFLERVDALRLRLDDGRPPGA